MTTGPLMPPTAIEGGRPVRALCIRPPAWAQAAVAAPVAAVLVLALFDLWMRWPLPKLTPIIALGAATPPLASWLLRRAWTGEGWLTTRELRVGRTQIAVQEAADPAAVTEVDGGGGRPAFLVGEASAEVVRRPAAFHPRWLLSMLAALAVGVFMLVQLGLPLVLGTAGFVCGILLLGLHVVLVPASIVAVLVGLWPVFGPRPASRGVR